MKISDADIERQLRLGEDSVWEFKASATRQRPQDSDRKQLAD